MAGSEQASRVGKAMDPGALAPGLKALLRGALDVVMPPQALDAGQAARVQGPRLSPEAWGAGALIGGAGLGGCRRAVAVDEGEGGRCPACQARPRAFDRARAAVVYDDHSRDLILKLKHADRTDLAALFAAWLSRAARDLVEGA